MSFQTVSGLWKYAQVKLRLQATAPKHRVGGDGFREAADGWMHQARPGINGPPDAIDLRRSGSSPGWRRASVEQSTQPDEWKKSQADRYQRKQGDRLEQGEAMVAIESTEALKPTDQRPSRVRIKPRSSSSLMSERMSRSHRAGSTS